VKNLEEYRAVLFDFDGVVGDTYEDGYRAWVHALAPYHISYDILEYASLEGHKAMEVATLLVDRHGLDRVHVPSIVEAKDIHYKHHSLFKIMPGVLELIFLLKKQRIDLGLVTGARARRVFLPSSAFVAQKFDVVITAEDVQHGKPSPEPYLKAATRLKVPPSDCIVLENAPLGIRSAKAAGMACIAVTSTLPREYLEEADLIVDSLNDLVPLWSPVEPPLLDTVEDSAELEDPLL